jgi:predicted  nucleic acid-binding Zn-ribbon protein
MTEQQRGRGEVNEGGELDRLRERYKEAFKILEQARAEHKRAMNDLMAKGTIPKTFNDSFEKLEQAEREAFAALEAWAKVTVKED